MKSAYTAFFQTHNWEKSSFFNASIRIFAWIYANMTKCPFLTLKCNWSTNSLADSKPSLINGFCGASFRPFKFLNVTNSDDLTIFSGHRNVKAFHHKSSKNQSINAMFDWCGKSIKFLTCALANGELLRFIGKIQKAWCFPFSFAIYCFVKISY